MTRRILPAAFILLPLLPVSLAHAQTPPRPQPEGDVILPLWPTTPPLQVDLGLEEVHERTDILRISNVQTPWIEVFHAAPANATGMALVILPGGGYRVLAYEKGGSVFARWLAEHGITGVVVKYRLPGSPSQTDPANVPLLDAQRAIRLVRHHARDWGLDPDKVGVMGSSAGGHLAATLSTQSDYVHPSFTDGTWATDAVDSLDARPAFSVLVYPVITFRDPHAHRGSRRNLIGETLPLALVDRFSADEHVSPQTPPTFLIHSQDDRSVPIENSLLYHRALRENGVTAQMHLYPDGGHGFGFGDGRGSVEGWPDLALIGWLRYWERTGQEGVPSP